MYNTSQWLEVKDDIREQIIYNLENDFLPRLARRMLKAAYANKSYSGFTGNTQTSYMVGLYKGPKLVGITYQDKWTKGPIFRKVKKDEYITLKNPYEGEKRTVKGKTEVDDLLGAETSEKFLKAFPASGFFTLVFTTGTEYSEYIISESSFIEDMNAITDIQLDLTNLNKI